MIEVSQQTVEASVAHAVETGFADAAADQDVEKYSESVGRLADRAAVAGHYGLQDVCLLIVEALPQNGLMPEGYPVLNDLPKLFNDYSNGSEPAIQTIINILRHPALQIALLEDEVTMLENQLTAEIGAQAFQAGQDFDLNATDAAVADNQGVETTIETIAQLADRAAVAGHYGLQDACLLIVEALEIMPEDGLPELSSVLADLPKLFNDYCNGSGLAIHEILNILKHPVLKIALTENEVTMLESQLIADIGAPNAQDNPTDASDAAVTPPLSKAMLELIELLVMEAALIDQLLSTIAIDDPESIADGLERIADELERYMNASRMAGFEGLALVCEQVNANIQIFRENLSVFTAERLDLLHRWINNVKNYLAGFSETGAGSELLAQLGARDWPLPVNPGTAAVILAHLQAAGSNVGDQEQEPRKQLAVPEDISINLPDDINQELLDILLHELPEQIQQFSAAIQRLQTDGGLADLEIAQRVAHTVKGAANTVGIKGIAELTHYLEDILVACAQNQQPPGSELLNVLIDAADCLEAMSESLTGFTPPPGEALAVLQTVLDWANRIDREGIPASDILSGYPPEAALIDASVPGIVQSAPAEAAPEKLQAAMIRVATEQMEGLLRLAGENIILNSQASERLRRMKNQLQAMDVQFGLLLQLGDELEQLIDLKDLSGRSPLNNEARFDALEMDQYNELHTASRRLVEAAFDVRELTQDVSKELAAMNPLMEDQQRLVNETQETLMKTRLVPVASIIPRLQRGLRQTCRLTRKHCNLSVSGEHLMVDGDTLNSMIDPLMHLLRNAVDHGIESEAERLAAGKLRHGHCAVEFDREGNQILVRVRDDGRGLDFAAIRDAAERRGAIQPGQSVSEDELKHYILRPNFSTRTQTTQTSGRGVGMDAVHHQVLAQGGTLTLQSVQGQGLAVEMKIPLPLSRTHALLTQAGPYRLAISSKGIAQILFAGAGELTSVDDEQRLQLGDDSYPVITLDRLLNIPEKRKQSRRHRAVLLVQNDEQITAVLLDAITHSLDIVIKNMGCYIKKIPGFIGAAILGDGSVAPVLDMPELLRTARDADDSSDYPANANDLPLASTLPTVLVVDDSLSQRRALEQLLQDAGFQVRNARDGIEAAQQLAEFRPDIVLTDLEMPRMNGIELTAHIRSRENLKTLPIIMITSRTTQTHRKMAEDAGIDFYLVKPVREDDLLTKMQDLIEEHAHLGMCIK